MTIDSLQARLREFAAERDWQQFHDPKNLTMALTGEVGELVELFQWLTPDRSRSAMDDPDQAAKVREELADVFGYLLRLADVLDVDLEQALVDKIAVNELRYPADQARGRADKYTRYQP